MRNLDIRLRDQHQRHTKERNNKHKELKSILPAVPPFPPHITIPIRFRTSLPHRKPNIHHRRNNRRSPLPRRHIANLLIPILEPLKNNQKVHIPKKNDHEHYLRDKLKIEIELFLEM